MFLLAMIGAAHAAPDLVVERISLGCTGSGGDPTVIVTVRNVGNTASSAFYLDVFRDEPVPPPIGALGEQFHRFTSLAAGGTTSWSFAFPGEDLWTGWVDLLVDTDEIVAESNEGNNHFDQYTTFLDCSFN